MPSEFSLDLCFVRTHLPEAPFADLIEEELGRIFASRAVWHTVSKQEDGLDISVVAVNGLSTWMTEDEVLDYLDSRMESECWEWLNGYQLKVVQKEDAGSCRCRK